MASDTFEKVLHRLQHAAGSARELINQDPAWLRQELLDIAGQLPTSPGAQSKFCTRACITLKRPTCPCFAHH
eukprot:1159749-Pelagomonas_calceolata.AAC.6